MRQQTGVAEPRSVGLARPLLRVFQSRHEKSYAKDRSSLLQYSMQLPIDLTNE